MDTTTLVFLCIGGFSVLFLLLSLLGSELHIGHSNFGGWFSLPVLAGFTGAFGFTGAIAAEFAGTSSANSAALTGTGGQALIGTIVGLSAAVPVAWLAGRLVRSAKGMATDTTLTGEHLVGTVCTVVTPVAQGRYGEVRLEINGQVMRLNARSDHPLPLGAAVLVIGTTSPTCVHVEPIPQYFSKEGQ